MSEAWAESRSGSAGRRAVPRAAPAPRRCGLDELRSPTSTGPRARRSSVRLTASPDIILADGFSTSLVQATLLDQNGRRSGGPPGLHGHHGRSRPAPPTSATSGRTGPGRASAPAWCCHGDGNGVAQAAYEAPARTDFTANGSVMVPGAPVGDDFATARSTSTVRIELRSAEPRLFPQIPGTSADCNFAVEPCGRDRSA